MNSFPTRSSTKRAAVKAFGVVVCSFAMATTFVDRALAQCVNNLVLDGDFVNDLQSWPTLTGTPQFNANGCNGTTSAQMWGNLVVGESIKQALPGGGFVAGRTYRVTVSYRWLDINPTAPAFVQLRFSASASNPTGYPPVAGYTPIGVTPPTSSTTTCATHTFPDFTPTTNLPWLTINPQNDSSVNDGGQVSWAQIDGICIQDVTPPRCEFNNCRAKEFSTSMVRAFTACNEPGGNTPNTTTVGNVPACAPPVPLSSYSFKPKCGGSCNVTIKAAPKFCGSQPCCCITATTSCAGILAPDLSPATGLFRLNMLLRITGNDQVGGDMTLIDFPLSTPMTATSGKIKFKSGCLDLVSGVIPQCSAAQIVDVAVTDPLSDRFAVPGVSCCLK